jgi:hypothetical protein
MFRIMYNHRHEKRDLNMFRIMYNHQDCCGENWRHIGDNSLLRYHPQDHNLRNDEHNRCHPIDGNGAVSRTRKRRSFESVAFASGKRHATEICKANARSI